MVAVEIAPLAAVADRAAAESGALLFEEAASNLAGTLTAVKGDADAAFRAAAYVRRETFEVQRHTAVPMELRGVLAEWHDGRLTVYGAAKVPFPNRRILAKQLGMPESAIRMVENDVGGGFGVRGEFYPEDFLIPFAARVDRAAGQVDRGPPGAPPRHQPCPRRRLRARDRLRPRRHHPRAARPRQGRRRRLHPHQRRDRRAQHRADSLRSLSRAEHPHAGLARAHQQDAGRHLSRAGAVRGRFLSRAAVRHGRARSRHRPRRVSPPQPDRGKRDALCRWRASSSSIFRPRPTAATTARPSRAASRRSAGPRRRRCRERSSPAATTASPSAAISRAAPRGRGNRRASCWRRTARSRSMSARRRTGRVSRPCSPRSPPTRWRCRRIASAASFTARPTACAKASAAIRRARW